MGVRGEVVELPDLSPRLKALKASSALRTISMFSRDIAHAGSLGGVLLSMQSGILLPR
jgi:hypothetical protein